MICHQLIRAHLAQANQNLLHDWPESMFSMVRSFRLMPVTEVRRILETADAFLFDAVPILSDCLMRHGHFTPEDADYVRIAELVAAAAARPSGNGTAS